MITPKKARSIAGKFAEGRSFSRISQCRFEQASGKYPPAEPGALGIGPLEAAVRVANATLHLLAT
jgi:hypothetical protein